MTAEENKLIESYIDEIAQFGDGAMEIQSKDLQQLVLIAKRESDARLKSQEDTKELVEALREAIKIKDLWIYLPPIRPEHIGEAQALYNMQQLFESLIAKHSK